MKRTFNWLFGLLAVTILNSAFFGFITFVSMWGISKETDLIPFYLPSTVVAILVIIFALIGKKKGGKGALWLPIVLSLGIVISELLLLFATIGNPNNLTVIILFVIFFVSLYSLFRYYFFLHREILKSEI